jgi:hypothetical protein
VGVFFPVVASSRVEITWRVAVKIGVAQDARPWLLGEQAREQRSVPARNAHELYALRIDGAAQIGLEVIAKSMQIDGELGAQAVRARIDDVVQPYCASLAARVRRAGIIATLRF